MKDGWGIEWFLSALEEFWVLSLIGIDYLLEIDTNLELAIHRR